MTCRNTSSGDTEIKPPANMVVREVPTHLSEHAEPSSFRAFCSHRLAEATDTQHTDAIVLMLCCTKCAGGLDGTEDSCPLPQCYLLLRTCIHVTAAEAADMAISRAALLTVPFKVMTELLPRLLTSAESNCPYWKAGFEDLPDKMALTATELRLLPWEALPRLLLHGVTLLKHLQGWCCRCCRTVGWATAAHAWSRTQGVSGAVSHWVITYLFDPWQILFLADEGQAM